jgi:hypothetical protein
VDADGSTDPRAGQDPVPPILAAINRPQEVPGISRRVTQFIIAAIVA